MRMAAELLTAMRGEDADFRAEQLSLLLAVAWMERKHALTRFGTMQVRVEFALWTVASGVSDTARQLSKELEKNGKHWPRHVRSHNLPVLRQIDATLAKAHPSVGNSIGRTSRMRSTGLLLDHAVTDPQFGAPLADGQPDGKNAALTGRAFDFYGAMVSLDDAVGQ